MKKLLLATALSLCVTSAFAADPTAVLKVKGLLTNAACMPTLSNSGVVNYGTIRLGSLSASDVNQLGQKDIELTITCASATKVSWNMVDDRADTRADITVNDATFTGGTYLGSAQSYGVGLTGGNVKIGAYTLFVKTSGVVADTNTVDTIYQQNKTGDWTKSADGATQGSNVRDITVATAGTTEPLAFLSATFPLVTSLAIQDTATLAITDDTNLNGQVTISLRYL